VTTEQTNRTVVTHTMHCIVVHGKNCI